MNSRLRALNLHEYYSELLVRGTLLIAISLVGVAGRISLQPFGGNLQFQVGFGCSAFKSSVGLPDLQNFICILARLRSRSILELAGFENFFGEMECPFLTVLGVPEEVEKLLNPPARTYVRDSKAMASTPADIKEYPDSYVFVVDMPGLKPNDIKVQVDNDNVLSISGERKRDEKGDAEVKYIRMERRTGKFLRKFTLPADANREAVSAAHCDGVLTVTVPKIPPPEPKKPKVIEVTAA